MIRKTDLFEDLPAVYHDSAYLDRIYAYIPGWEMDTIRGDVFCTDFGFIVDYLAEALKAMRPLDFSGKWQEHFELHPSLSTRDRDGVQKTYSGLMKIIHPTGEATKEEQAEILECALELRKRVKDQLYRIDETAVHVSFAYREKGGAWMEVHTLEEDSWPSVYHALDLVPSGEQSQGAGKQDIAQNAACIEKIQGRPAIPAEDPSAQGEEKPLFEGTRHFRENQREVSYELPHQLRRWGRSGRGLEAPFAVAGRQR